MPRTAMVLHSVHGSDANLLSRPSAFNIALSCTGGSFKVIVNGVETGAITASASLPTTATLQAALQALSSVGAGNAIVTGTAGSTYNILLLGPLQDAVNTLTTDATLLTGGGTSATVTTISEDMDAFDHTNGMSCPVTGNQTILLYNPSGGSAITVTVPSAPDKQNRKNDALINAFNIPTPGWLVLPKFTAQGWSQGAEGVHLDSSAAGLLYLALRDPTD